MATTEQKSRLLKVKIAVVLHDELGRVPTTQEIEQVFLLTQVRYQAVAGAAVRASCWRVRACSAVETRG